MANRVLAVGEALVDIVHSADGTVTEHPGGSVANVAVALARLGQPVDLATWIGADEHGARIADWLRSSGVRLTPGSDSAARTPSALATVDDTGSATYEFDLEWHLPGGTAAAGGALAVHTGSIAAVLEPAMRELVTSMRATSTLSYDPNVRPAVMGPRDDVRAIVEAYVALADVVKVSDEDLAWLEPDTSPEAVAQRWLTCGPALVVLTRGAVGALAWCAAGEHVQPAASVDVVDTVGAGDAFTGALLWSLANANLLGAAARDRLRAITPVELGRHVLTATCAAELTVQRAGSDPPSRRAVEEYRRRR